MNQKCINYGRKWEIYGFYIIKKMSQSNGSSHCLIQNENEKCLQMTK